MSKSNAARQRTSTHRQRHTPSRIIQQKGPISPEAAEALTGGEMQSTIDGDRRWFLKHPGRAFHLRAASEAEIAVTTKPKPPHHRWYTIARQIKPGFRVRATFSGVLDGPHDRSESEIVEIYARAAAQTPSMDMIEEQLQAIAAKI
jgi:hypothetical protein